MEGTQKYEQYSKHLVKHLNQDEGPWSLTKWWVKRKRSSIQMDWNERPSSLEDRPVLSRKDQVGDLSFQCIPLPTLLPLDVLLAIPISSLFSVFICSFHSSIDLSCICPHIKLYSLFIYLIFALPFSKAEKQSSLHHSPLFHFISATTFWGWLGWKCVTGLLDPSLKL